MTTQELVKTAIYSNVSILDKTILKKMFRLLEIMYTLDLEQRFLEKLRLLMDVPLEQEQLYVNHFWNQIASLLEIRQRWLEREQEKYCRHRPSMLFGNEKMSQRQGRKIYDSITNCIHSKFFTFAGI